MKALRRFAAATAAAVVMVTGGALVAQADTPPTVYNTPGGQTSQGRLWNTECEKYSTTVVRCRTDIWATAIEYRNGRYQEVTGWTFNNLSYLPSTRDSWKNNNLGKKVSWASEGRKWKTDCDSAATGRGGCRTYLETDVFSYKGGKIVKNKQWVFNNLVQFSSSSIPAVSKVPAHILDQSRLKVTGIGPLAIGAKMDDLAKLDYISSSNHPCVAWNDNPELTSRGIRLNGSQRLSDVFVDQEGVKTTNGAEVGMTLSQLKTIYGSQVQLETKDGYEPVHTATFSYGNYEIVFLNSFDLDRPLKNSDVINMMIARERSDSLLYDGC